MYAKGPSEFVGRRSAEQRMGKPRHQLDANVLAAAVARRLADAVRPTHIFIGSDA